MSRIAGTPMLFVGVAEAAMLHRSGDYASTSSASPTRSTPLPRGIRFCPNVTPSGVRR
jgi:hypothetical protein